MFGIKKSRFVSLIFLETTRAFNLRYAHSPETSLGQQAAHTDGTIENYERRSIKSALNKSGGLLYRTSVFKKDEVERIRKDVSVFGKNLAPEHSSSIAVNRQGARLPDTCQTYEIFQKGSILELIRSVAGEDFELSTNIPVEIRQYEKPGASMSWHVDDVLYDPPQIEVVWTLENTSDCSTLYKRNDQVTAIETDPNAVLVILAGGPSHCVTSLKNGSRIIIKCAYVQRNAIFREKLHNKKQFGKFKERRKRQQKR